MHSVTVIPPAASGYPAFPLTVLGDPTLVWSDGNGFETAEIPCALSDEHRSYLRLAVVIVSDPDWFGLVWEAPQDDGVLHALGWHAWATLTHAARTYSDTARNILLAALGELPAAALAGGAVNLSQIADPADVLDIVTDPNSTLADVAQQLATATDHSFGWYGVKVSGQMRPLPCFYPHSTTPDWLLDCRTTDTTSVATDDVEPMISAERVTYNNGTNSFYVDVADTDPTHYLARIGLAKQEITDAGQVSLAVATAVGSMTVAARGREIASGSILANLLQTIAGGEADIAKVRPGQMVRLLNLRGKPYIDCAITRKTIQGTALTLDLDSNVYRLSAALAIPTLRKFSPAFDMPDYTPPDQVTGLTVVNDPGVSNTLSWDVAIDDVATVLYNIEKNDASPGSTATLGYVDNGVERGAALVGDRYRVRGVDAAGNIGPWSEYVAAPDTTNPSATAGLAVLNVSGSNVLSWTAATDDVRVVGYEVMRTSGFYLYFNSAVTSFSTPGAIGDTYKVRAYDAAGNYGDWSSEEASTDGTAPSQVVGLGVVYDSEAGTNTLTWTAATDDVAVTGYEVEKNDAHLADEGGTSYIDSSGLLGDRYRVRAYDAAGNYGAWSVTA